MIEYGPWIKHDGRPVTHLAGRRVQVRTEDDLGQSWFSEIVVNDGKGGSWRWCKGYTRVTHYRIHVDDDFARELTSRKSKTCRALEKLRQLIHMEQEDA